MAAVRSGDFKLIEFFGSGTLEMYNITGTMPDKAQELAGMLHRPQEDVGALMPEPNPEYGKDFPEK